MIVTRKWIMQHRTDKGAWTQPQIEALGIEWPPRHGWIDRVVGKEIPESDRYLFESKVGIKELRKRTKIWSKKDYQIERNKEIALEKWKEKQVTEDLDRKALNRARRFN